VAVDTAHHVLVQLPQILETGRLVKALERGSAAALAGAVVQHGDPRLHRVSSRRRLAAVPGRLIHIDRADAVFRTQQRDFLVPREVAEVGEPEPAVLHDDADRCRVLRIAVSALRDVAAVVVRRTRPRSGFPERFNDRDIEPLDGNPVAGRHHDVLPFRERRRPVFRVLAGLLLHRRRILQRGTVIDEGPHWKRQVRNTTGMIAVKMRDEQRIDPRDLRDLCNVGDPRRIAPDVLVRVRRVEACKAHVDHECLARRRDEQRRLAALGVDEIDVERLAGRSRRRGQQDHRHDRPAKRDHLTMRGNLNSSVNGEMR